MMERRTFVKGGAAALGAMALAGCSSSSDDSGSTAGSASTEETAELTTYKIGVIQLTEHDALDNSNDGFVRALDEAVEEGTFAYEIDQQNAQNDQATCTTIANTFVGDGVDLIYAIATPAAQAAAAVTTDIPIVGCAITDFADSDLVESNEEPGGNVTGASDLTPVTEQIDMLVEVFPDATSVGLLYCSAESNSEIQIQMAEEACDSYGLEHERYSVASSNEIQSVVESMSGKVDVVYAPTDNTIAAAAAQVGSICIELGLPFVCGEEGMVEEGGLFTLSIDYEALGHIAGEMALRILVDGEDPAEMPIEYTSDEDLEVVVNEETAEAIGVDVSMLTEE